MRLVSKANQLRKWTAEIVAPSVALSVTRQHNQNSVIPPEPSTVPVVFAKIQSAHPKKIMSFLKSSTSFTIFKLTYLPDGIINSFGEKLRQFAFMPIDDNAEVSGCGWTSMADMEDFDFVNSYELNKYFYFSFRVDKRNVPASLYKRHIELALKKEEQELAKVGLKYITKQRKKEIKEQVRLKLLARTLPTPAVYEVVWDYCENTVYFACTNKKIVELFGNYFLRTLGADTRDKGEQLDFDDIEKDYLKDVKLYQLTPYNRAILLTEGNKAQAHNLGMLFPTAFNSIQPFDFDRNKNIILGEEFLTWLWYHADSRIPFTLLTEKNEKQNIFAVFENKMSVRGSNGENSLLTSLSGNNNPMDEARIGLATGKKVNNACISFSGEDISFLFSLNAKNFSFSSFQILNLKFEKLDFDTLLLEKMIMLEQAMSVFDTVYEGFLTMRLDEKAWKEETEKIKLWIMKSCKEATNKQSTAYIQEMGKKLQDIIGRE